MAGKQQGNKEGIVMAEITFNYQIPPKSIGGFAIDAFINERYSSSNSVTDVPMEDGSRASDHVVENALEIQISGFIGRAEGSVMHRLALRLMDYINRL
jgi:hypothetical protein